MYVEDVEDGKSTYTHIFAHNFLNIHPIFNQILCILKHVKDVKDRSNTPKGCNAMYFEDVKDGKRTCTHIFAHNFLNIQSIFNLRKVLES